MEGGDETSFETSSTYQSQKAGRSLWPANKCQPVLQSATPLVLYWYSTAAFWEFHIWAWYSTTTQRTAWNSCKQLISQVSKGLLSRPAPLSSNYSTDHQA